MQRNPNETSPAGLPSLLVSPLSKADAFTNSEDDSGSRLRSPRQLLDVGQRDESRWQAVDCLETHCDRQDASRSAARSCSIESRGRIPVENDGAKYVSHVTERKLRRHAD